MKKLMITILILGVFVINTSSQDLLGFENIAGNDRIDYKNAELKTLEAASYLITNAIDTDKKEREKALTYMLMWMEGTPDFVFYIDDNISVFTRSNKTLLSIYMAGLTKLCLENPGLANNRNELKYRAIQLYIDYCINPSYHVKPFRQLEKLVKARDKGRLEDYIAF